MSSANSNLWEMKEKRKDQGQPRHPRQDQIHRIHTLKTRKIKLVCYMYFVNQIEFRSHEGLPSYGHVDWDIENKWFLAFLWFMEIAWEYAYIYASI